MCNSVNADGSSGPPIRGELSGLYAGLPPLEDRPLLLMEYKPIGFQYLEVPSRLLK